MLVVGHSPRTFYCSFLQGLGLFQGCFITVKWKECNNFLQVFFQNCGAICLFRRISVYAVSPVILLNSFELCGLLG